MNWIAAAKDETAGKDVMLASLTPRFDEANHRVYYDLLKRAIDAEGVRNVALTGAYGTGKSSVLEELRRQSQGDVIEISLSTIAPPQRDAEASSTTDDEKTQTNLIQKEIVKQLLYRLPAHKTPRSRFRRTSAPQTKRDWIVSAGIGLLTVAVGFVLGLLPPVVDVVVPEPWGRRLLAYSVIAGAATCVAWLIRRLIAGGPTMSASVGAGLTSVTLSSAANTYFDEYLDEIVYFFQASKTKVVVIEDIDRFEDVKVFDTLRALNVLLNSSSVLGRIVFVYAIRDSIFEQIESVSKSGEDLTRQAVQVASRAKFFDVIVPVVPFVNADNARDLMSRAMTSARFAIDQSLIRVVARHTADMRLIHNIRNEFEVYRNRLIVPKEHMYGINNDLVFAMIVFKNAHLADFEKIRHKDSSLDHLYREWRDLVRTNLKIETGRLDKLRASAEVDDSADERARLWAERFLAQTEVIRSSLQGGNGGQTSLSFVGEIDESMLAMRSTWRSIATGLSIRLQARTPRGYILSFDFDADQLADLLGIAIDPAEWGKPVQDEILNKIEVCEERIRFLRHHTWEELRLRPEFTLQGLQGPLTFEQLLQENAPSPLIEELVQRGFITSHFALYTSTYYGTHLGPDALEYVRRCIEPGEPDSLFQLDTKSVRQLLIEQGADQDDAAALFDDASIRNVSIMDYLLRNRPQAAARVAKGLSEWGEHESEFVATYCSRGEDPELLLAAMAPWWPAALQYAAVSAPLPSERRVSAVDGVLGALPNSEEYATDEKVRDLLEAHYAEFVSLTAPKSSKQAAIVVGAFASCQAMVRDVSPLNHDAREQVITQGLYPVTKDNLLELTGAQSLSLDDLLEADERVYKHAVHHLGDYLAAYSEAEASHTIDDPRNFVAILTSASKHGNAEALRQLVSQSDEACEVAVLSDLPVSVWPTILVEGRTHANFTNVHLYIAEFGRVDEELADFLSNHHELKWDEDSVPLEDRRNVSIAILNASDVLPNGRVRLDLAAQLDPGVLTVQSISPETGEFASGLIEKDLVSDDAETFASALMVDWKTRESAIVVSGNFESFVSPETLPVSEFPQLLRSDRVTKSIKRVVASSLADYLEGATSLQAEQCARALNEGHWTIGASRIEALLKRGVSVSQVLQLIVRESDLSLDKLRYLLRQMGDPYARLADPGRRPVHVPDDEDHNALLGRLEGVTVSTYKKTGTQLKVNLFRLER
ncbi:AAA ATPase domain-containing protein [Arthrobacter sp. cf158]|uniref:YobI family P-loop NTPase n=1 Tax=Arthrobacter sp. cf158 TaxID=1761744 RepID=UPI00089C750A|nr:P-loop NTPase fold protein [Arthrobacter sp. cf158]SDW85630.1 AAA ATPase domain-containing protein [Arthrobacter sp. cf158]